MANFYFLVMSILQLFPIISDTGGVPILVFPLALVVFVSMVKDIFEDL